MNYFRKDNTEGFTEKELYIMNTELALAMKDVDPEHPNYEDIMKYYGDRICNSKK